MYCFVLELYIVRSAEFACSSFAPGAVTNRLDVLRMGVVSSWNTSSEVSSLYNARTNR